MTDANTICHDLDLLDDWLAGKGYGEEAGLVLRALSLIHKLQDGVRSTIQERDVLSGENFDLRAENEKLREQKHDISVALKNIRAENAKLRAALKPFADVAAQFDFADDNEGISGVLLGDLRAAAAALKDKE